MNKNLSIACLAFAIICSASSKTVAQQSFESGKTAEDIISRHIVRSYSPPARIPTNYSVDAPVLGNGSMGVALSGAPDKQVFYLSRNDFWRLKAGYHDSYPLALGKLEIAIPQLEGASYLTEQYLYDAITVARFAKGNSAVKFKAIVAATDDVFILEISAEGSETITGTVSLQLPEKGKEIIINPPLDEEYPEKRDENPDKFIYRAFEEDVDIPTRAAAAIRILSGSNATDGGRFTIRPGEKITLVCASSSNFKSDDCLQAALEKANKAASTDAVAQLEAAHKQWWHDYWQKSYVSIPDSVIEGHYYLSLYGTASASRDPDFPPGLFGQWITREQPAWLGDYHLNYNFQAPFYALYSANRLEQETPYLNPILAFMERGKYYSEKISDNPEGVIYPVGIGPLGIETTLVTDRVRTLRDWARKSEYDGYFHGQKSDASYCLVNIAMRFYHTYDKDFTRRVYPFVKAVASFWEKYLVREGDRYVIYNDAIHEQTYGNMNPILSLGFVKMTMQTALDMSELLDADRNKRKQWIDLRDHISDYPLMERDGKTVFRLTEKGPDVIDVNSLALQHVYPAGQIGLDSDPKLIEISRNTLKYKNWLDENASNSIFPTAVRVGVNPDTILFHLNRYARHTFVNGFQSNNPHGVENWSTTPNTINEMLCMGHQGVLRLFPVWNRALDAEFHTIRAEGAFLVSARLHKGIISNVTVFSEQGRTLTMLNPWQGAKVKVTAGNNGKSKTLKGERLVLNTKPNTNYSFEPIN
ncbi:MAG: hypothetical protein LBR18_07340 [Tannerella sp.]|jgi:hypothetical protein|nr:hypothetical protein [Tannerella sp.]